MHARSTSKGKKFNFHRLEIDHDEGASAILNNRSSNPRPFQQYLATKTLWFLLLENISKEEKEKVQVRSVSTISQQSTTISTTIRRKTLDSCKTNTDRSENLTGKHPSNYPFLRSASGTRPWRRHCGTQVQRMVFHRYLLSLPRLGR